MQDEIEIIKLFLRVNFLTGLPPGLPPNNRRLKDVKRSLDLIVLDETTKHFVFLLYFRHDIESACKRLSLAGALIQSFLADSLDAHGLSSTPGRKTVQVIFNLFTSVKTKSFRFYSDVQMAPCYMCVYYAVVCVLIAGSMANQSH